MEVNAAEARGGARWFFGAGLFAIVLSIGLFVADEKLSSSQKERELGSTIRELRTAQSALGSQAYTDPRQSGNASR